MSFQLSMEAPKNFCDQQSLQSLQTIQAYGALLVIDRNDLTIVQVSNNVEKLLGFTLASLLNHKLSQFLSAAANKDFQTHLRQTVKCLTPITLQLQHLQHVIDCWARVYDHEVYQIIEIIPTDSGHKPMFLEASKELEFGFQQIDQGNDIHSVCQAIATLFKNVTSFDKVMVYQFDEKWCGSVVAEALEPNMESYLGLKFPASDVPKPVRDFYQQAKYRYIPSIHYEAVQLIPATNPITQQPLDLTHCQLRAVAPVHLEYLQNMGIQSSTSFSLLKDGQLWGLITCHHRKPKYLSPTTQISLNLLAEHAAARLTIVQTREQHLRKTKILTALTKLTHFMLQAHQQEKDFTQGLIKYKPDLLEMVAATGGIIHLQGRYQAIGNIPEPTAVYELINWLQHSVTEEVFVTDSLMQHFSAAKNVEHVACGLIALQIVPKTDNYILLFRPAITYTIKWAGNPNDTVKIDADSSGYHPRLSFKLWEETVKGKSLPWDTIEIETAAQLRLSIIDHMLRQFLQQQAYDLEQQVKIRTAALERSNEELEQFAYISSHQLKEPLRMVASFSQLLARRYQHALDSEGQEFIEFIVDGAIRMQELIDDVLTFSKIGKQTTDLAQVSIEQVLKLSLENLKLLFAENAVILTQDSLPVIKGDETLLTQLFSNLISNAIKFKKLDQPLVIHIGAKPQDREWLFSVRDNGIGIEPQYFQRIFKLFYRLHSISDYPGTGIGLAVCKKVVDYHGGRMWVESEPNMGSTFYFTIAID